MNDIGDEVAVASAPPAKGAATNRARWRSRGQSMVEFALILPVLVVIMALAADFGRAFTAYIAISSAAREGAAYGAQSAFMAVDSAGIADAALDEAPEVWGVSPSVTSSLCTDPLDPVRYDCVQVTVTYTFSPIITIPPIPNSVDMQRTVRMRVLN